MELLINWKIYLFKNMLTCKNKKKMYYLLRAIIKIEGTYEKINKTTIYRHSHKNRDLIIK